MSEIFGKMTDIGRKIKKIMWKYVNTSKNARFHNEIHFLEKMLSYDFYGMFTIHIYAALTTTFISL